MQNPDETLNEGDLARVVAVEGVKLILAAIQEDWDRK